VNRSNPQNRVQIPLITSGVMSRLVRVDAFAASLAKSLLGRDKPMAAVRAFTRAFRACCSLGLGVEPIDALFGCGVCV
jgi:hypothetical protein